MVSLESKDALLQLVRLGIGTSKDAKISKDIDWESVEALAKQQGLFAVVFDGVEQLPSALRHPLTTWLRWIGEVQLEEKRFNHQWNESCKMALLFQQNNIRTYILKGFVVSECYPKPQHRVSSDVDCFFLPEYGDEEVWEKGNQLMEKAGYKVGRGFYKNSSFQLIGLTVENHRYMVPFRGNKTLRKLEWFLRSELKSHKHQPSDFFPQTSLIRPPGMVSALFLIEHAYSHFLHEGLTWRHMLDWVMFSRKHKNEIDWYVFDALIDEFGFRKFYDAYIHMGQLLMGELSEEDLTTSERKMLADVWAPLDLHETLHGVKGKLGLVGNTLRARWKYHYFSPITMPQALWIQVKGFLFMKNPQLT